MASKEQKMPQGDLWPVYGLLKKAVCGALFCGGTFVGTPPVGRAVTVSKLGFNR